MQLCRVLMRAYSLSDLLGHESLSSSLGYPHSPSGCTDVAKLLPVEGHRLDMSVTGVEDLDVSRLSAAGLSNIANELAAALASSQSVEEAGWLDGVRDRNTRLDSFMPTRGDEQRFILSTAGRSGAALRRVSIASMGRLDTRTMEKELRGAKGLNPGG